MILFFYSNFLAAILKMANLTVIGLYFSLETVIFAFYGKFPIRMRMSPYSTNDVRMDLFLGSVSEMESRLLCFNITYNVHDVRRSFRESVNIIAYGIVGKARWAHHSTSQHIKPEH